MKNLQHYINNRNNWNSFFGTAPMNFPLQQSDADDIAKGLDCALSPENLHCDGEISRAEAQRKYDYYGRVIQELEAYCNANALTMPTVYEYY